MEKPFDKRVTKAKEGKKVIKKALLFFMKNEGGFGVNELLGIAAALILAAFIIIPSLSGFTRSVMQSMTSWWETHIDYRIFPDNSPQ
jgi:hypothetical protein